MTSRFDIASEPTAEQLAINYHNCINSVNDVSNGRDVIVVAVSKTKSPGCINNVYKLGHRVFGENYVQELIEKAKELPPDIQWHFIGHLQSNKVKELIESVPSLHLVETVDSIKLADKLNIACATHRSSAKLRVYVQVNTSGEESKSGVEPGAATVQLAQHITQSCPSLELSGLMTIGMPDYTSTPENFTSLIQCRTDVAAALGVKENSLQLSMGMSGDYINAIKMGSTSVRVGTAIFGQRYYPPKG